MDMEKVYSHIDSMKGKDLLILKKLVSQPSISAHNIGVRDCAELLKDIMEQCGIHTELIETPGQPIVFGEVKSQNPNALSIIFYGHYDVQPPEPLEEWISPPFQPEIRDGRLFGRGVADNKGQLITHVFAVRSYLKTVGRLPINIKFIFEGEEEMGSESLPGFVEKNKDLLKTDLVYVSDGPMHESGAPIISFGNRGVMNFMFVLQTATTDNHSGNKGGVIPDAAWEMVHLLSTMKDADGNIKIEGFFDDVKGPSEYDLELVEKLSFNPEETAKVYGVEKIKLSKNEFYRRLMFEPTLTINGLVSGHTGEGSKNIIPGHSVAKLDIRLVPDQDPDDIFQKVKAHVKKYNPNVKVVPEGDNMLPSKTPANLPQCMTVVKAVKEAYRQEPQVVPMSGGSLPNYVWTNILGAPFISVPYANADEANHAPNENLSLYCFYKGIRASAKVIYELSKLEKPFTYKD